MFKDLQKCRSFFCATVPAVSVVPSLVHCMEH